VARIALEDVHALVDGCLSAEGVPRGRREIQTRWLVEAEARGHASHGIQRLPVIVQRIRAGLTAPESEGTHVWRMPTALDVDGGRGLGPCVGVSAMDALCSRAPETGVAVAAIHDANHLGILAPYVEQAAEQGLIGIAITVSEPLVHPWGGRVAMLGTNPLAVAVPAAPEPFVLDMATGAVSMGKVLAHRHSGTPLEPGWAIDADGRPTLEAAAAAEGAVSPFGGPKGYALGLALELVVGALTGTALGRDVTGTLDAETVCNKGDVLVCLDPRTFGALDFEPAISAYLQELRESPPQAGYDGPSIPGDRARSRRARAVAGGIEIADSVLDEIDALGQDRAA
jgi:L-2-hydroxycarboxylate dehydrogenase (NAD+)